MSRLANEMLVDIEKDVIEYGMNFDNTRKEPLVLPSRFPNLLVNGSIGIAVGMATNIPPHNLGEVIDATVYMIDHPDCTVSDLMQFIKGPDFPTYGTIYGTAGIREAYMTGRGRIRVRAKAHFEEKRGRTSIIVTELPYQVNRSLLLENMVNLVKTKRIDGISDIRNESGRAGMRIVIEIKKDANAAGCTQPAVQIYPASGYLCSQYACARRGRAEGAQPQGDALLLYPSSGGRHPPAHAV